MKRAERERLIERYLSGEMNASEEQNFFIEVAADTEMRTELKAYQIVESAVRKDREADAASYADLRSHMLGVLQASNPAGTGGAGAARKDAPQAGSGVSSGTFFLSGLSGILSLKILFSVGAGAFIVISAMLVATWNSDVPENRAAAPATVPAIDTMPSPGRINTAPEQLAPALEHPVQQLPVLQPDAGTARSANENEAAKTRKARSVQEQAASPEKNNAISEPATKSVNASAQPVVPQASVPRTLPRDTSAKNPRIKVMMKPPQNGDR